VSTEEGRNDLGEKGRCVTVTFNLSLFHVVYENVKRKTHTHTYIPNTSISIYTQIISTHPWRFQLFLIVVEHTHIYISMSSFK